MLTLVDSLKVTYSESEALQIEELQIAIEESRHQLSLLTSEDFQERTSRIAPYRLRSSGTLKVGERESWVSANLFVAEKVSRGIYPTWSDILQINSILTKGNERTGVRTQDIFLGNWKAISPEELEKSIYWFEEILKSSDESSLVQAALVQYVLVSLHPFWDGNGRTSVLVADWILGLGGYLPQTFERQTDAIIAFFQEREEKAWKVRAVSKVLHNIRRSYEIVLRH